LVKVAVYTIALNEAAHAERWANSAADADYRVVADTGSSDDTVERLIRAGVTVHEIAVRPWRFDIARNTAMALLPADADVCLSMDMDEFLAPGWRPKLEGMWTAGTTALYCQLALRWSLDEPNPHSWPAKKFHARWGYRFRRAVHEELVYTAGEEKAPGSDILIHHVQDRGKNTRAQYLPLLEIAHREDPNDSQICFWFGRDSMWAGRHDQAIAALEHYLALSASTWREERAEAMRCLARMQPDRKMHWLDRARNEAPQRRETWLDLAQEYHAQGDWLNMFWACANGIDKTHRTGSYLDDPGSWDHRIYDLGMLACWQLDIRERALEWGRQAAALSPGERRLRANLETVAAGKPGALATAPQARLYTSWGTTVFADPATGELRHGPLADSPDNAALLGDAIAAGSGRQGWLACRNGSAREPAICHADHAWAQSRALGNGDGPATATALRIVPLERGMVGLRAAGLFLCAEPDGRLSLSKPRCSTWECFLPAADWAAISGDRPADGDPAIDWPRIRSFAIPPTLHGHLRKPSSP
jgi:tetratricopeptide (TPR) repeat protein